MGVLLRAKAQFRKKLENAYKEASQSLEKVKGEEVRLTYPYKEGKGSGSRIPKVTGTIKNVEIGSIPSQNVKFTTCITFEDGRTFTDSEEIEILS